MANQQSKQIDLINVSCCVCESEDAQIVGQGKDYEYKTSEDIFVAMKCNSCGLVYLNPRPKVSEFKRIYPSTYHAFNFSEKEYGIVHKIRSRLEAQRLLKSFNGLAKNARILDVGCGDGFHLKLLRDYGKKSWELEGVDLDERAVANAKNSGLTVYQGSVETIDLPENSYDGAYIIQTIEHVESPDKVLLGINRLLKPGGILLIVTDNTDSLDFGYFKKQYWGGYHFPRHWNLFNKKSIAKLAVKTNFEIDVLETLVSPVNWTYTIHNWLVGIQAPNWLINRFTLKSTISLSV
ncbi:MAG: class I SAM-dependent methyltransferase, partial [Ginsengibacter sp.]